MDRIYRTVNINDQETQHYYSHLIQHDARQRCPALIVLKEEHNNNNNPWHVTKPFRQFED